MMRREVSVGYAIGRLRSEIDGGAFQRLVRVAVIAYRAFAFAFKFCLAWLIAGSIDLIFGMNAALVTLFVLLGWLILPRVWKVLKFIYGSMKGGKGIFIGVSYPRIAEQYANADANPRRATNITDTVGEKGPYHVDYASEPNPHVLVVGSSSSGKTSTAKTFICRNYLKVWAGLELHFDVQNMKVPQY